MRKIALSLFILVVLITPVLAQTPPFDPKTAHRLENVDMIRSRVVMSFSQKMAHDPASATQIRAVEVFSEENAVIEISPKGSDRCFVLATLSGSVWNFSPPECRSSI